MDYPTFEDTAIVGMRFRGDHAVSFARTVPEGETLFLERETDNRFDGNAVKVLVGPERWHLGYVNKDTAMFLARWMDEGAQYIARVVTPDPKALICVLEPVA